MAFDKTGAKIVNMWEVTPHLIISGTGGKKKLIRPI